MKFILYRVCHDGYRFELFDLSFIFFTCLYMFVHIIIFFSQIDVFSIVWLCGVWLFGVVVFVVWLFGYVVVWCCCVVLCVFVLLCVLARDWRLWILNVWKFESSKSDVLNLSNIECLTTDIDLKCLIYSLFSVCFLYLFSQHFFSQLDVFFIVWLFGVWLFGVWLFGVVVFVVWLFGVVVLCCVFLCCCVFWRETEDYEFSKFESLKVWKVKFEICVT